MEISIKGLSKKYKGNKFGLKNFDLELKNGILGLLGPNGAGKSTLMRILATISKPTEGTVTLDGIDIVKFPDTVRKILGYLPQDFGIYPNLTAMEFLVYIAAIKGFTGKSIKTRIEALLDELNLAAVKNKPIGTYSGGMKQRIGIAQVLVGDPKLLILDEPTVGLDPEERVRFRNLLADLSGERVVILSSHIVSDIETIAGDIAIVFEGRSLKSNFHRGNGTLEDEYLRVIASAKNGETMQRDYTINSICHIARADFLQRIRSYYFLIALGVCVFIIYSFVPPVDAGYTMVSLGNYRGFYNSAWVGSMVAMCVPFFALIGFYLVNNSVKRDIDTGVGQIVATTRITNIQYLTGKLISNFAVLMVLLLVIAAMTIIMFIVRGETNHLELGKLLMPLLILTVPAMFIIAALGLFFDSFTRLSRGFINIAYFFLWIFLVSGSLWSPAADVFGGNTAMIDIKNSISAAHPDWNGSYGTGILIIDSLAQCRVFIWEGMTWTPWIFLQRICWVVAAFGLVLLASLRFNRFDATETNERKKIHPWFLKKKVALAEDSRVPWQVKYSDLPVAKARFSYLSLLKAELLLMLRGNATLWLVLTAGMFLASAFAPLGFAYKVALPLLWFFQVLILSKLGSREVTHRCNEYVFSAASPLMRQLPSTISAAVIVMLSLAMPVLLRVFISGNLYGVYAIATGAMFVPAFAITSGILTGGSKLFEVIFTMMVYGILNKVPFFDFVGAIETSRPLGVAHYLLAITLILTILAILGRKWQIRHAGT